MTEQTDGITLFWDDYEAFGVDMAISRVMDRSENGSLIELEMAVPYLVDEAKKRNIDMIKFLTELDAALEKLENATRVDNGSDELPFDIGDEADQAQDGHESESAQDVDGEARAD